MAILPRSDASGKAPEASAGLMFPPGLGGYNVEPQLGVRRVAQLDSSTRVAAQLEKDRGAYIRPPVLPVEYGEGNIKKSVYMTGAAGYNQRNVPLPDSPDDMSQNQYMLSLLQNQPQQRLRLQQSLATGKQNFLNIPTAPADYPLSTHNMMNNLLALSKQKLQGKVK